MSQMFHWDHQYSRLCLVLAVTLQGMYCYASAGFTDLETEAQKALCMTGRVAGMQQTWPLPSKSRFQTLVSN